MKRATGRLAVTVLSAVAFLSVSSRPGRSAPAAVPSECRTVGVEVVDATGAPLAGVPVEVLGHYRPLADAKTDAKGCATLRLDPEQPVQWVVALKPGAGLDYYENYHGSETIFLPPPARDLPETLRLTLDGARRVKVHAIGDNNADVPGVRFVPWVLCKQGKHWHVNLSGSGIAAATSDARGIATFDWLPSQAASAPGEEVGVTFLAASEKYDWLDPPDVVPYASDGVELTARVYRNGTISGKVCLPNGKPAAGIEVMAEGRGRTVHLCCQEAVTAADGSYTMNVSANQVYVVAVLDENWTAATQAGIEVRPGEAKRDVDFALEKGLLVGGQVVAPAGRRLAGHLVFLRYKGPPLPEAYRGPVQDLIDNAALVRQTITDSSGSFAFHVPPGDYELGAAAGMGKDATHYALRPIEVKSEDVLLFLPSKRAARVTASVVKANHGEPYDFATLRVRSPATGANGCASCHRPHFSAAR